MHCGQFTSAHARRRNKVQTLQQDIYFPTFKNTNSPIRMGVRGVALESGELFLKPLPWMPRVLAGPIPPDLAQITRLPTLRSIDVGNTRMSGESTCTPRFSG